MKLGKYRPVLELTLFSGLAFVFHLLCFHFFAFGKAEGFRYTIPQLYGFFFSIALIIVAILIIVKSKNIDSVGNTFMLLTCLKMVLAYVLLHPILESTHPNIATEKANFFFIFAIFLAIETMVSIRMLNRKQA